MKIDTKLRNSAHKIIDGLPDDRVAYVIAILRGIQGLNIKVRDSFLWPFLSQDSAVLHLQLKIA